MMISIPVKFWIEELKITVSSANEIFSKMKYNSLWKIEAMLEEQQFGEYVYFS